MEDVEFRVQRLLLKGKVDFYYNNLRQFGTDFYCPPADKNATHDRKAIVKKSNVHFGVIVHPRRST